MVVAELDGHEIDAMVASGQIGHHRADAPGQARQRKLDEAFRGKAFEVEQEIHLPPGKVCLTMLGHKARHVFIIRDTATGDRHVVTARTLRLIHDEYSGVELPDTRPRLTG